MLTDIEIAQQTTLTSIEEIAENLGLSKDNLDLYGKYKAKITLKKLRELQAAPKKGKLILVTAITPTPAGEGKSTISIALADGIRKIGKNVCLALREPSLGPCFGIKGGACGGGYAQVVPMEDINLHFTGDIHAISIANNLIAALVDNHIQQGNSLNIDPRTITWKRCVDLNDRALRKIVIGLGGRTEGIPREDGFNISVASEIMAIICLSRTISELKTRLDNIIVGKNYNKEPVLLKDLKVSGAVAALLKDTIRPNLVQTLEKTPAFIHGGPFANIAHGCNSINATECALALGDYVVTEAGFAADLGAEKFLDIKSRIANLHPEAVVVVATIRALKMHGGVAKQDLNTSNVEALKKGFENLKTHVENLGKFKVPVVIAINQFASDTEEEINALYEECKAINTEVVLCQGHAKGGEGATALAEKVCAICDSGVSQYQQLYPLEMPLEEKIRTVAKEIYRAKDVSFSDTAKKKLAEYTAQGYGNLPICMAKTQYSFSHDKSLICAPRDFIFPIQDVRLYAGAGFIVPLAGDIMTMPGLPKVPAACQIDVDDDGVITGLF